MGARIKLKVGDYLFRTDTKSVIFIHEGLMGGDLKYMLSSERYATKEEIKKYKGSIL